MGIEFRIHNVIAAGDANITTNDTIFMVSFQLPVNVVKNQDGKWDIEDKAALGMPQSL